ncbi:MAG TPA: non-canonical purine NTP pyrophosphatase [Ktedonobacteraceae bacterium]|nr:non-canonical purine NTP pyrophosphatase [Ktedonobacteraceae bacterium]
MIDSLTFITSNPGKARQLGRYLDFPVIHKNIDLVEMQSLDLTEIIEQKAKEAYKHIRSPVLVEDTSLRFLTLGRLPGPLIKWFLTELGTNGLCKLLDGYTDRSALAEVQFGLYDGEMFQSFAGSREGSIAPAPRGNSGFGWDSIFIPKGYHKTWGEMTSSETQETSMRKIALKKLEVYLSAL